MRNKSKFNNLWAVMYTHAPRIYILYIYIIRENENVYANIKI